MGWLGWTIAVTCVIAAFLIGKIEGGPGGDGGMFSVDPRPIGCAVVIGVAAFVILVALAIAGWTR